MAHHLMAVCVVCLLCAEHLPCKEHVVNSFEPANAPNLLRSDEAFTNAAAATEGLRIETVFDKRLGKTKTEEELHSRSKRHAGHGAHEHEHQHQHLEMPEVTKLYIKSLFERFSNRTTSTMNVKEFEKMMEELNLDKLLPQPSSQGAADATCLNEMDFLGRMTEQKLDEQHKHDEEEHNHDHDEEDHHHHHHDADDNSKNSTSPYEKLRNIIEIESDHFLAMCPILLYSIVSKQDCLNSSNFLEDKHHHHDEIPNMEPRSLVWLYSTLSIIGVSLCGLFGVAVIPIMDKHYYHHVLQFLVALAVGTLTGDALLHLLPHAMMPIDSEANLHHTMMQRGLAAVFGIVFFYFFERFLTMVTEWRQLKQKRDKPSSRVRVMRDPESVSLNNGAAATCKHKYSSYPYCYDEIAMDTKDDHHEHQHVQPNEAQALNHNHNHNHHWNNKVKSQCDNRDLTAASPTDKKAPTANGVDHASDTDNATVLTSLDEGSIESNVLCNNNKHQIVSAESDEKKDDMPKENYTIILR